jgi:hypothetical protein
MVIAVIVALIGATASLVLGFGNLYWARQEKDRERKLDARQRLDRYREPLLTSIDELGNRIDMIRNRGFLYYFHSERSDLATKSTLYRLAHYLGWIELLYGYSGQLRFASEPETMRIADTIGWIASTLAEDRYDPCPSTNGRSQLLLWREEQRAIGELMRIDADEPGCIGYSEFVRSYDKRHARWFTAFCEDLLSLPTPSPGRPVQSERLEQLHALLARLLVQIDLSRVVVQLAADGSVTKPRWATNSSHPPPRDADDVIAQAEARRQCED